MSKMETIKRPKWIDSAEKFFRENHNYAGSPKWIARTCCEVSALYNGKQINGETVVDVKAVQDGLNAYSVITEQPYKELGVIIETSHPYRALLNEDESNGIIIFTEVYENGEWKRELKKDVPFYVDPVRSAASSLGRLGGLSKSDTKVAASRENGRKGGRPKSTQSIDMDEI